MSKRERKNPIQRLSSPTAFCKTFFTPKNKNALQNFDIWKQISRCSQKREFWAVLAFPWKIFRQQHLFHSTKISIFATWRRGTPFIWGIAHYNPLQGLWALRGWGAAPPSTPAPAAPGKPGTPKTIATWQRLASTTNARRCTV